MYGTSEMHGVVITCMSSSFSISIPMAVDIEYSGIIDDISCCYMFMN